MMNCLRKTVLLTGIISLPLQAQQSVELSWQRDSAAEVKHSGEDFAVDQLAISGKLYRYQAGAEQFNAGLNLQRTRFDWAGGNQLDETHWWLGVPLNYRQKRSGNTEFIARLEPGLMASRKELNQKALFANAELSGRVYVNPAMFWQLGVVVDRSFGDANVYPLAAFAWKPDSITEVQIGFPYSKIYARWSDTFSTYAKLQPSGGVWRIDPQVAAGVAPEPEQPPIEAPEPEPPVDNDEDANAGAADTNGNGVTQASKRLKYQSWQLALGTKVHWRKDVWINAETGYHFDRKLEQAGVSLRPENALYWKLALQLEF